MNEIHQRFPAIEKIDPIPTPGTLRIGYVVVAKQGEYFNAKHKRAVEQTLRCKLTRITKMQIQSGTAEKKARLTVNVQPPDSIAGFGSFIIHDTLLELFKPETPYLAITAMQSPLSNKGNFFMGMQILGNPDESTLRKLEARIRTIPYTVEIRRDTKEMDARHFIVTVKGPWNDTVDIYREELIKQAGVASTLLLNTRRL